MGDHQTWQFINKTQPLHDSDWIEEEDRLLNWAENPIFERQPLNHIAATFIYIDTIRSIVGVLKTSIDLEKREKSSILYRSDFFDKVTQAKHPVSISIPSVFGQEWSEKTYSFEHAAIYSIPIEHDQINQFATTLGFTPLEFSNDIVKIPSALIVLHDSYEIVVTMREVKPVSILKTNTNSSSKGKTKKVQISDDSPKEFVFSKTKPVSGKRRTRKYRNLL